MCIEKLGGDAKKKQNDVFRHPEDITNEEVFYFYQ